MQLTKPPCKIDGCDELAEDTAGIYAKLCPTHKAEAKQSRVRPLTARRGALVTRDGALPAVTALRKPAQRFDAAKAKLDALPSREKEKAAFDEAARRAQMVPSKENLDRLAAATKTLQQGAPRREKLEQQLVEAERDLRAAVTELAVTLKKNLATVPAVDLDREAA